jgi:cbb3-type cytochrome oxidase subunit 1
LAGRIGTGGNVAIDQPDDALRGAQVIKHSIGKQSFYELMTVWSGFFGLFQTPLRTTHIERNRLGWQVIIERLTVSWSTPARVNGFELMRSVDPDGGLTYSYIDTLSDMLPRY